MRKLLASLALVLIVLTGSAPAWAGHNSQAAFGKPGREVVEVECPAGEVLTGFTGRTGGGIDQI